VADDSGVARTELRPRDRDLLERNPLVVWSYFVQELLVIPLLCSPAGPGRVARVLFHLPLHLDRLGLARAVTPTTLFLTTTGRRTGRPRVTPVTYRYDAATDTYYVISGWGTRSSWYRNVEADPRVRVKVGRREFAARAEPAGEEEALRIHRTYNDRNRLARWIWPSMTGVPFDPSEAGLRDLARRAPVLRLKPPTG
jgi:deazaflavin-dependent oxidoreductase (nitroreductase family)